MPNHGLRTSMYWYVLVQTSFLDVLWWFFLESYTPGQVGTTEHKGVYATIQSIKVFHDMVYCCMYSLVQCQETGVKQHFIWTLQLKFIIVCTSKYEYVRVNNMLWLFHHSTLLYARLCTRTYCSMTISSQYTRVCTRSYPHKCVQTDLKWVPKRSQPEILCILSKEHNTALQRYRLQNWDISLHLLKSLWTWWLMSDRRHRSHRAPAPCHDVSLPSLDLDLP